MFIEIAFLFILALSFMFKITHRDSIDSNS